MLGLVASMGIAGLADADETSTPVSPVAAPPAPAPFDTTPVPAAPPVSAPPLAIEGTQAASELAPVTLTARPDVRVVERPATAAATAPAPAATTSGSR